MGINDLIIKCPDYPVLTKTYDLPAHFSEERHRHSWHQILFPVSGLLQSEIENKSVIVPHNGLLFIPANALHKSVSVTKTQFLAVFLNPKGKVDYGVNFKSCLVTPFLKELILLLMEQEVEQHSQQMTSNLLCVLRDQITTAKRYEIPLLIPKDRRLMSIFSALNKRPDLPLTLAEWAKKVGASQRTLSRLCAKEFNQSFAMWRQNIRLVLSLQCLEKPLSIQDIALELGYQSDSAYIHAFKGLFTQTPSQYRKRYLLG